MFDFSYLKNQDEYEDAIQEDSELLDKDETFKNTYFSFIERFYILFESKASLISNYNPLKGICKYYNDLDNLIEEVRSGVFIEYTLENILLQSEGRKLISEAFYLYGCMLFLLDYLIPGKVRERIVIFYIRYKGLSAIESMNDVVKLVR